MSRSRLQIAVQTLWNIKLAVLVKPEHENRISHVGMSSVKTGIANTLGNGSTLYSVFAIPSYVLLPASKEEEIALISCLNNGLLEQCS